ncbi:hypothetical protein BN2537_1867 [Streptomyces venezuelae]|nr:hypothetical protein BN2537_1867 [Streptomyces venezuelae]
MGPQPLGAAMTPSARSAAVPDPDMPAHEFRALYERLRRGAASTEDGRPGALRHVTPERVMAAVAEVRLGRTVSLAAPIETVPGPDAPSPRCTG